MNYKFELPNGSYSVSDTQDHVECINKKHETLTVNPSIKIDVNKIEKIITVKIKIGSYLELLISETMILLGSTKKDTWR